MTHESILSSSKRIKHNRAHSLYNDNNMKSRNPYSAQVTISGLRAKSKSEIGKDYDSMVKSRVVLRKSETSYDSKSIK